MKIALIGYGKMGHMIEDIARQRGHEIVCIIDINNMDDFESEAFRSADVAIEFTNPTLPARFEARRKGSKRQYGLAEGTRSRCAPCLYGRRSHPLLGIKLLTRCSHLLSSQ